VFLCVQYDVYYWLVAENTMPRELPDATHEQIKRLCAEGDSLAEVRRFAEAVGRYKQALALVPVPPHEWEAATWIYAAMGDAQFLAGEYEQARVSLTQVMLCPNALENPFIWLRRGQVYFELGDTRLAEDSLASAFMLGGREIFDSEDQKYAAFILPKIKRQVTGD
jgi:tetratricopeptide (TPR) repeat protein